MAAKGSHIDFMFLGPFPTRLLDLLLAMQEGSRAVGKRVVHIFLECFLVMDMLLLSIRHLGKSAENLANKGAAMSRSGFNHICASVHELNLNVKKEKIDNRKVDSSFFCK